MIELLSGQNKENLGMVGGSDHIASPGHNEFQHTVGKIVVEECKNLPHLGIILGMGSANERRRYNVTSSLNG